MSELKSQGKTTSVATSCKSRLLLSICDEQLLAPDHLHEHILLRSKAICTTIYSNITGYWKPSGRMCRGQESSPQRTLGRKCAEPGPRPDVEIRISTQAKTGRKGIALSICPQLGAITCNRCPETSLNSVPGHDTRIAFIHLHIAVDFHPSRRSSSRPAMKEPLTWQWAPDKGEPSHDASISARRAPVPQVGMSPFGEDPSRSPTG